MFSRTRRRNEKSRRRSPGLDAPENLEERRVFNADWTVLMYANGQGDLESYTVRHIKQIEHFGSTEDVNFAMEWDKATDRESYVPWCMRTADGSSDKSMLCSPGQELILDAVGDPSLAWTDTRRALIEGDPLLPNDWNNSLITTDFEQRGGGLPAESNYGSAEDLQAFLEWGVSTYPADKYMVIFDSHGSGIGGLCCDDESVTPIGPVDPLEGHELGSAFEGAAANIPGFHIDVVGMDASAMGQLEVLYELRDHVDHIVGRPSPGGIFGWDYHMLAEELTTNPHVAPDNIASQLAQRNGHNVYDVSEMQAVQSAIDSFADTVMSEADQEDWTALRAARDPAFFSEPGLTNHRELGRFLEAVVDHYANTDPANPIHTAAANALSAFNALVVQSPSLIQHSGISIYSPEPYDPTTGLSPEEWWNAPFGPRMTYSSDKFDFLNGESFRNLTMSITFNAPYVRSVVANDGLDRPWELNSVTVNLNEDASIGMSNIHLYSHNNDVYIDLSGTSFTYSPLTASARLDISSLHLEPGYYTPVVTEGGILDAEGVGFDGDRDGIQGGVYYGEDMLVALPGDIDTNGIVDGLDWIAFYPNLYQSGTDWYTGDFNQDNVTDGLDYVSLIQNIFSSVERDATIPPPLSSLVSNQPNEFDLFVIDASEDEEEPDNHSGLRDIDATFASEDDLASAIAEQRSDHFLTAMLRR